MYDGPSVCLCPSVSRFLGVCGFLCFFRVVSVRVPVTYIVCETPSLSAQCALKTVVVLCWLGLTRVVRNPLDVEVAPQTSSEGDIAQTGLSEVVVRELKRQTRVIRSQLAMSDSKRQTYCWRGHHDSSQPTLHGIVRWQMDAHPTGEDPKDVGNYTKLNLAKVSCSREVDTKHTSVEAIFTHMVDCTLRTTGEVAKLCA